MVQDQQVADLLGEVDDVVEDAGQGMDVLALEGNDERRLEVRQDLVVDVVAAMLQVAQPVGGRGRVGEVAQLGFQHARALGRDGRLGRKEFVELQIRRDEAEAHRGGADVSCMASAYGVSPPTRTVAAHGVRRTAPSSGRGWCDGLRVARPRRGGPPGTIRRSRRRSAGAGGTRRLAATPDAWASADLQFDRDGGWSGRSAGAGPWSIGIGGLTLELRPTDAGQVGLFPEHAAMLPWLRGTPGRTPVLNLFAYTGLATLALAAAGAAVAHVDASRPTVAWARRNAELSG